MSKRTVFKMLDTALERYANKPYLSQKGDNGWERVTFSETKTSALLMASALIEIGVKYEDKITILSEAKNDWIISEFAILFAGSISVPLSIKLLPDEVLFRVNHSDSKLIIASENTLGSIVSQWKNYNDKSLKIIILDKPTDKIKRICKIHSFGFDQLLFIDDLYKIGKEKLDENKPKIDQIVKDIKEDDVVTISYTSGTTGNPKGIMLTHLNYFSESYGVAKDFNFEKELSSLIILPIDHSFAHTLVIYIALLDGFSIHFIDSRGGSMNALKNIAGNLTEVSPNFLLTVPALTNNFINKIKDSIHSKGSFIEGIFNRGLNAAIKRNGDVLNKPGLLVQISTYFNYIIAEKLLFRKIRLIFGSKIKYFVGGGALLDIKQQQFYQAIGIPIYQGYGLTEAAPAITLNTKGKLKLGTSGKVISSITCKICDDDGNEVTKGKIGEIVIQGENVMKGYYKNPTATAETLKDGWLHTGDLGYMDEDDYLIVSGRRKALLISEDGEKYSPEEIEEAIVSSSSLINQAMIYNDHHKYTISLITLNHHKITQMISDKIIKSYDHLMQVLKEELHSFNKEIEYKGKFPNKWIPSNFQIIEEEFSEANKMINSTMKMVRHKITDFYHNRLELMYKPNVQKLAKDENLKILAKMFDFGKNKNNEKDKNEQ